MSAPPQSKWSSLRRGLILFMLVLGGTSFYSLFFGRPGDFEAGLVGLAFGGIVGLMVGLVEVIGRLIVRIRVRSTGKSSSSDKVAVADSIRKDFSKPTDTRSLRNPPPGDRPRDDISTE